MSFKAKMKPLDDLFTLFYLFSPIVSGVLATLEMNMKLLWLPLIAFLFWTLYIYAYRAKYMLQDEKELSFIERARGLLYFFGLVVTLISYALMWLSSRSLGKIMVIYVSMFALLYLIRWIVPRVFFQRQTKLFTRNEKAMFDESLSGAIYASIFYSCIVVALNFTILYFSPWEIVDVAFAFLFTFIPFSILAHSIYRLEQKSREVAGNLVVSLKGTGWLEKYLQRK